MSPLHQVKFLTAEDANRHINTTRVSMFCKGNFSIQTCYREVYIPFDYLVALIASVPDGESHRDHIDAWFLKETLNAAGGHSTL